MAQQPADSEAKARLHIQAALAVLFTQAQVERPDSARVHCAERLEEALDLLDEARRPPGAGGGTRAGRRPA